MFDTSELDKNKPAFPSHGSMGEVTHEGMMLRDYFAAKAMQSILSAIISDRGIAPKHAPSLCAESAYKIADAMLKAREA